MKVKTEIRSAIIELAPYKNSFNVLLMESKNLGLDVIFYNSFHELTIVVGILWYANFNYLGRKGFKRPNPPDAYEHRARFGVSAHK